MNAPRIIVSALLAVVVTTGLFLFMHKLVFSGAGERGSADNLPGIRFGPVDVPDELRTRDRRIPKKPPPPKNPPPPPKMQVDQINQPVQNLPQLDMPNLDVPMVGGSGMFLGNFATVDRTAEGDIIPVVRIPPQYPREAAISRIEGWVKVEFTITEVGTVKDPRVIDSKPARVFDRSAIRAILRWKFKPRIIDGVAVERQATQTIDFTLDG
jgi:protein TonB